MDTLGLSMIVKDEPVDRVVMLLDFMSRLCNQMVILDTGSENYLQDREWYLMAGATTVEQIEWRGDFAWARNQTLPYLGTEWTLHLDADELPSMAMMMHIEGVLYDAPKGANAFLYFAQNFWGGRKELLVMESDWHLRLFRTRAAEWYKPVHEQVMLHGKQEGNTRGTPEVIKAPRSAYFINSKPAEMIEKSNELYTQIGEGADRRSI